jgi:hypothetical protein
MIIFSSFRAESSVVDSVPPVAPGVIHIWLFQSLPLSRITNMSWDIAHIYINNGFILLTMLIVPVQNRDIIEAQQAQVEARALCTIPDGSKKSTTSDLLFKMEFLTKFLPAIQNRFQFPLWFRSYY